MQDLNKYMEREIGKLVKTARRFYLNNPRGVAFIASLAREITKSAKRRAQHELAGTHVPPAIIASITARCNLHCAGCYSRAFGGCSEDASPGMTAAQWERILQEASDLGVSFVLLAGGEPLMRRDIIETAAKFRNMVFPVFTNGTMIDESYLELFRRSPGLVPVLSIEGDREQTDGRRGGGAYDTVQRAAESLRSKKMLFGASITVTKENLHDVTKPDFVRELREMGCGLLFFVEYVPAEPGTESLMLDDDDNNAMLDIMEDLRQRFSDMMLISFPGDEQMMGGCLASGRGFFHINAVGGAEPCPFSPYSAINLQTTSMKEALRSGFFEALRGIAANAPHNGGCTLFNHEAEVRALLQA